MKRAAAVLLGLAAGACATGAPAPISYGGGGPRAPAPAPVRAAASTPAAPEEVAGPPRPRPASTPDWAARPGPSLADYALQPDDVQPFDPARTPRTYRVGANEQLYDIATRYQVPLRALIEQNNLTPPYTLSEGRDLRLPPPRMHRVANGESFEDVARRYNVDLRSLALLNRMEKPYQARPGDMVVLPAIARAPEPAPVAAPAPSRRSASAPASNTPASASAPPPAGSGAFAWPLRGQIVARFGAQSDHRRLDGIEIAASEGARAGAAADGEVVYAGADLPAYGSLVLVRHAGDYVTAYGYGARTLVREGQRVHAGDALLEVGRIGGESPRLLFQIRRGSQAVDPAPLLGG